MYVFCVSGIQVDRFQIGGSNVKPSVNGTFSTANVTEINERSNKNKARLNKLHKDMKNFTKFENDCGYVAPQGQIHYPPFCGDNTTKEM